MEVEALNAASAPIEQLTVPALISSLQTLIDGLDTRPVLMGALGGGTVHQSLGAGRAQGGIGGGHLQPGADLCALVDHEYGRQGAEQSFMTAARGRRWNGS